MKVQTQPDVLLLLIDFFFPNKRPVKCESNISVITDFGDSDLELLRACQFSFPASSFYSCLSARRLDRRSESWSVPKLWGLYPSPFSLILPFICADSGPPNENMLLPNTICSTCTLYEKIKKMWHHSNETD